MTIKELKQWIGRVPDEAKVYSYEGEARGLRAELEDGIYWFIDFDDPECSQGFGLDGAS